MDTDTIFTLTKRFHFKSFIRLQVDKKCPDFRGIFGSVEQMIELDFTDLRVLLHLQGLQEILVIANEYQVWDVYLSYDYKTTLLIYY